MTTQPSVRLTAQEYLRIERSAEGKSEFINGEMFGMGGAYLDGKIVVAIMFTRETLAELYVDRFPSFIGTFKLATSSLAQGNLIY